MFFNKLLKPAVLTIACAAALTAGSFGNVSFFHEAHAQTSQLSGLPDFTKLVEDNGKAVVSTWCSYKRYRCTQRHSDS